MRGAMILQGTLALAAGAAGAVLATFATAPGDRPRAGRPETASSAELCDRVAALEKTEAELRRDRDAAQKQGAEAMALALDARRDLDRLGDRVQDLLAALDGTAPAGGSMAARRAAAADAGAARRAGAPVADGAATTGQGQAEHDARAGEAAGSVDVASVRQALAQVRKEEMERHRQAFERRQQEATKRRMDELAQRLGLTTPQQERIAQIWDEGRRARGELIKSSVERMAPPMEMRSAMQAQREKEDAEVASVLTPAQQAEYQKVQDERRQSGGMQDAAFFVGGEGEGMAIAIEEHVGGPEPPPGQGGGQLPPKQ